MHIPLKFKQQDTEKLLELVQSHPFATLAFTTKIGVEVTHLPMVLKQKGEQLFLEGHIAKVNKVWESIDDGAEVLVIFNGENCYISPNYYPAKAEHGKVVPTWNYVVVHVRGRVNFKTDREWLFAQISELSNIHEAESDNPWKVTDAPEDYIHKMLNAIVGIEIEIDSIEGQWKLSQNQPEVNRQGVIEGLSSKEDASSQKMAELVKVNSK
jgi:transcriptional regulator